MKTAAEEGGSEVTVIADDSCGVDLTWELDSEGKLTISGTGAMYDYGTAPWYTYRSDIKDIEIGSNVTSIGDYAFKGCTGLTEITIPENVTSIGYMAFEGCTGLKSVTIPENVTSIGVYAFSSCTGLTQINYNAKAADDLTSSSDVFNNAGTSGSGISVTFGEEVKKVPAYLFSAFYVPNIKEITFIGNAPTIGSYAFRYVTAYAYYPYGNTTWTNSALQNYGGTITWSAYGNTEIIPIVDHVHSYTAKVTPPTCTSQGYTTHTCSCGDSYVDMYVDELGHDYGEWTVVTKATCTEKGLERRDCSRCDVHETRDVNALGHNYVNGQCTRCGKAAASMPFKDVKKGTWYYDAVQYAYTNHLMSGVSDTNFNPDGTLTRAMFVTILGNMAGVDPSKYQGSSFKDVKPGQWYSPYVEWAYQNKITSGVSATEFGTNTNITREQMAALIANYLKITGITLPDDPNPVTHFKDESKVSSWAKEGLKLMMRTGLIKGDERGYFNPSATATRAQAAAIFAKMDQSINSR